MKRLSNIITGFLGISMFMTGVLKFIDPFKSWYSIQVEESGLPFETLSYWAGQLGEIFVGLGLIVLLIPGFIKTSNWRFVFLATNMLVIIMMVTATYVHLQPAVPAEVLPLKIRPPFIPAFFMVLAIVNLIMGKGSQR